MLEKEFGLSSNREFRCFIEAPALKSECLKSHLSALEASSIIALIAATYSREGVWGERALEIFGAVRLPIACLCYR